VRAALNPPPKWKAYLDAHQQRVRSFADGGPNDPEEAEDDEAEPEGMTLDEFLKSQQQRPPPAQATEDVTGAAEPQGMSLDQFLKSQQQEQEEPRLDKGLTGGLEAAGISAGRRVLPAAGAITAGLAGAGYGTAAGAWLAPFTGGLSIPAGALIGGVGAGLAAGFGGGYLANLLQDKVLDALGYKEKVEQYGAAAEKQFPKTSFVAGLAPDLAAFAAGNVSRGARLASAALQGAGEAASEYYGTGEISPGKVLTATGLGAVFAKPRAGVERTVGVIPGVRAAQAYAERAVAGAEQAAARRARIMGEAPEEVPGETPVEASDEAAAPEAPTEIQRMMVPEGADLTGGKILSLKGVPEGMNLSEAGVPVEGTAAGVEAQRDAEGVNRVPTAPGTAAQEAKPAAAGPTEFGGKGSPISYPKAPKFGKRTTPPGETNFTTGDVKPDEAVAIAGQKETPPDYFTKPAAGAEYAHGDEDMSHVTLNRESDVPGNVASDPNDPNRILIHRDLPPVVDVNGRPIDPAYPLGVRENTRRQISDVLRKIREQNPEHAGAAEQHEAVAKAAGHEAQRAWLHDKGYDNEAFKAAIGEGETQAPPREAVAEPGQPAEAPAAPPVPAPEPVAEAPPPAPEATASISRTAPAPAPEVPPSEGIPDFLRVGSTARPPEASVPQSQKVQDPAFAKYLAQREEGLAKDAAARAEIEAQQQAGREAKTAARLGRMRAERSGATTSMPLTGRAALEAIRQGEVRRASPEMSMANLRKMAADLDVPTDTKEKATLVQRINKALDAFAKDEGGGGPPMFGPTALQRGLGAVRRFIADESGNIGAGEEVGARPKSETPAAAALEGRKIEQRRQRDFMGTVKSFAKDEGGGGPPASIPQTLKMLTSQGGAYASDPVKTFGKLKSRYAPPKEGWRTRQAGSEQEAMSQGISDNFFRMNQQSVDHDVGLMQNVANLKGNDKKLMADADVQQQMYRAREAGKTGNLTGPVKALYDKHIKPLFEDSAEKYAKIKALTKDWSPEQFEEFFGNLDPTHVHRMAKGYNRAWDELVSGQSSDPVEGIVRGLKTNPSSLQSRRFFAIEDANGKRTVVTPTDEGLTLWDKGNATHVEHEGPFEVGNKITVNGKEYTARQALTPEIKENARFSDGRMADYHENAMASAMQENRAVNTALRHLEYLESLKSDPKFKAYTVDLNKPGGRAEAQRRGYAESAMPQMKGIAMDPFLKAAFDDFSRPGLQSPALDGLRKMSQAVTKTLFFTPVPHSLNAFWHWWVGRGWDWLKPSEYGRLIPDLMTAYRSVMTQDAFQRQLLKAGAGLVEPGVSTTGFERKMADAIGLDVKRNPLKWEQLAGTMGLGKGAEATSRLVEGLYNWSKNTMWSVNDILLTHQIMVNQRRGMSLEQAIGHAEQHIPNYRLPATILGSRTLAQVIGDPSTVAFGRYHYGVYNSLARMVKGLTFGDAQQRTEAAGNLFALGLFAAVMKPLVLDPMVQAITGDKEAETAPRGPLSPITAGLEFAEGKKGPEGLAGGALTLPPLLGAALQLYKNRDFAGRPIINPGASLPVQGGELSDQLASGLLAPFGTIRNAQNRYPGADPFTIAAKALGEQFVDIKTKKPGSEAKAAKAIRQEEHRRMKQPLGPFEKLARNLTQ